MGTLLLAQQGGRHSWREETESIRQLQRTQQTQMRIRHIRAVTSALDSKRNVCHGQEGTDGPIYSKSVKFHQSCNIIPEVNPIKRVFKLHQTHRHKHRLYSLVSKLLGVPLYTRGWPSQRKEEHLDSSPGVLTKDNAHTVPALAG